MSAIRAARTMVAGAGCALAACFYSGAPRGWLPATEDARTDPYGGWADVRLRSGSVIRGELLAVTRDSIHVLQVAMPAPASSRWAAIAIADIRELDVAGYDIDRTPISIAGVLGTVSTISHGFFLIFTVPMWVLASTTSASAASNAPHLRLTDGSRIHMYARFPAGLPVGVDRARIKGKNDNP